MKKILMVVALLGCLVSLNAKGNKYESKYLKDGSVRLDSISNASFEDEKKSIKALDYEKDLWVKKRFTCDTCAVFFDSLEEVEAYFHSKIGWMSMHSYEADGSTYNERHLTLIVDVEKYPFVMKYGIEKLYGKERLSHMKTGKYAVLHADYNPKKAAAYKNRMKNAYK